jgi:hypothetical protein
MHALVSGGRCISLRQRNRGHRSAREHRQSTPSRSTAPPRPVDAVAGAEHVPQSAATDRRDRARPSACDRPVSPTVCPPRPASSGRRTSRCFPRAWPGDSHLLYPLVVHNSIRNTADHHPAAVARTQRPRSRLVAAAYDHSSGGGRRLSEVPSRDAPTPLDQARGAFQSTFIVALETFLQSPHVRRHLSSRLSADEEWHEHLPIPCTSKSSAIVTRDHVLFSRGSTVTFTIALIGPSSPCMAQRVGGAISVDP